MDMGENMRAAFSFFNYWILDRTRFWRWNRPLFFIKLSAKVARPACATERRQSCSFRCLVSKMDAWVSTGILGLVWRLTSNCWINTTSKILFLYKSFANRTISICQSFWCSPGYLVFDPLPLTMGNVVNQSINISDGSKTTSGRWADSRNHCFRIPRFTRQNVSSLLVRQP